jgi:hypothetical protein
MAKYKRRLKPEVTVTPMVIVMKVGSTKASCPNGDLDFMGG